MRKESRTAIISNYHTSGNSTIGCKWRNSCQDSSAVAIQLLLLEYSLRQMSIKSQIQNKGLPLWRMVSMIVAWDEVAKPPPCGGEPLTMGSPPTRPSQCPCYYNSYFSLKCYKFVDEYFETKLTRKSLEILRVGVLSPSFSIPIYNVRTFSTFRYS